MIVASAWIGLFGCNLNCVSKCVTEIGNCRQKCEVLKIQDGSRRHLGCTKMLIASASFALFGCNFNFIALCILQTGNFHKKCKIKNPKWRWPPSCDLPRCYWIELLAAVGAACTQTQHKLENFIKT